MKKVALVILFSMLLVGCGKKIVPTSTEHPEPIADNSNISGVALSDKDVTVQLDPDGGVSFLTEDALFTNTTEIIVSIPGLEVGEEVVVYLYDSENMDYPIRKTTLSTEKSKERFSSLISITGYRLEAQPVGLTESRTMIVSD